jgi:ketosteroid isomerase-like protein
VEAWVAAYERAWRTSGTDGLAALFTPDVTYSYDPYEAPVRGLDALRPWWEEGRDGPSEVFTMSSEPVAVDGDVAVVRVEVAYGEPVRQEYRDLWVLRFDAEGRCAASRSGRSGRRRVGPLRRHEDGNGCPEAIVSTRSAAQTPGRRASGPSEPIIVR